MYINEKTSEVVVEALVAQITELKAEIWYKNARIEELKSKLEKAEGGNGKL